jgi:S-formylglutathione hydrolase FrmB
MHTNINVIIPEKFRGMEREGGFPVIYLLHGLSDDSTAWCRNTSIERYAENKEIIVVMPWAGKSFYTDMKFGEKVFTYISEELPKFCEQMFPISSKREDKFVAGLSMGGYGAFKLALSKPDCYAAAASLSGALDIVNLLNKKDVLTINILNSIYGENGTPIPEQDDLFVLIDNLVKNKGTIPKLYMICGTEDFLYEDNLRFSKHIVKLGIDAKIRWEPGTHEWGFWDKYIQDVLDWLPIK